MIKGRKAGPPLEIKRHYMTLTPKETQDAVESVAELIANFVQRQDRDSLKVNRVETGADKPGSGVPPSNGGGKEGP
ncbi:MAG: hypothetical protein HYY16_03595 [Planctomycetes bacterium]|nr:hypothetical protein [Planctomycetota bacterium]